MRRATFIMLTLLLGLATARGLSQDPEAAASRDVDDWRHERVQVIPWREHLADLSAPDPEARARALAYLKAMMTKVRDAQLTGRAPVRQTGAWGRGGTDLALETRKDVVAYLASGTPSDGALDALAWIVETDRVARVVLPAIDAIAASRSPRSTEILQRIVRDDLGGAASIERALQALARRDVLPDRAAIERCLRSHRRQVREAAAPLAAKAGIAIPPPPEGAAILETKGGAELMARLAKLVGPPLPEKTPWVEVETFGADDETDSDNLPVTDRGWLLSKTADAIEIETPNGYVKRIPNSETETLDRRAMRHRHRIGDVAEELARVAALRAQLSIPESRESRPRVPTVEVRTADSPRDRYDLRGELSDCGRLSSQFEPFGYSLYEVMLGFRVYQAGRRDEAAKVLIPVIEATPDDADFDYFVQWYLGNAVGHRMIARFCEHDLDGALALARRLEANFPRSEFSKLAARLASEIPRRSGDWKDLRLPTSEEWKGLSASLDREGQIRYLCERMRLVTSVEAGLIMVGAEWAEQYRVPGRVDHRATWIVEGSITVINPLRILRKGPLAARADGSGASGVDAQDVALLKACATDDWLCPCVSAWRDFHHARTVSTSSQLIDEVIKTAGR